MITLRAQRALFFSDAGVFSSHAGNSVSHAPLVHATRTLPANVDVLVRDLFTGRDTTFDPSATLRDLQYSVRVLSISPLATLPVRNQCAIVH